MALRSKRTSLTAPSRFLSRCAPSATAAKPLRLRAPFSGPAGRKAVHSAPCLSRLLPGAPRFYSNSMSRSSTVSDGLSARLTA